MQSLSIDCPRVFRAKMAAGLFHRKRLLAYGFNSEKTHPLQSRFKKHPEAIYLHAEIAAIKNYIAKYKESPNGLDLYVCRTLLTGQLANSKPCSGCQRALKFYGIKNVFYTTSDGTWTNECLLEIQ